MGHLQCMPIIQALDGRIVVGLCAGQVFEQFLADFIRSQVVTVRLKGSAGFIQGSLHLVQGFDRIQASQVGGQGVIIQLVLGITHLLGVIGDIVHGAGAGNLGIGVQVVKRLLRFEHG